MDFLYSSFEKGRRNWTKTSQELRIRSKLNISRIENVVPVTSVSSVNVIRVSSVTNMCYKTKTSQELRMLPRSDLWYYKKDALYKKVHFSFWWHKCGAFKKTAQCGEFEKIAQCGAFKKIAQCGAFKKIRQCIFAGDCTMCGIHVYDSTRRCAQGDTPKGMHQRWCIRKDPAEKIHQMRCNKEFWRCQIFNTLNLMRESKIKEHRYMHVSVSRIKNTSCIIHRCILQDQGTRS